MSYFIDTHINTSPHTYTNSCCAACGCCHADLACLLPRCLLLSPNRRKTRRCSSKHRLHVCIRSTRAAKRCLVSVSPLEAQQQEERQRHKSKFIPQSKSWMSWNVGAQSWGWSSFYGGFMIHVSPHSLFVLCQDYFPHTCVRFWWICYAFVFFF